MLFDLLWKGLSFLGWDMEVPSRSTGDPLAVDTPFCGDSHALVLSLDK